MKERLLLLCFTALLSACSTQGPTRVEEDFGVSVRQMIEEQKYKSGNQAGVNHTPPQSLGGEEALKTINRHNQSKIRVKAAKRPLTK